MSNFYRGISGICLSIAFATTAFAASEEIEFVTVGDAGNVAYPASNDGWRSVGAVNYSFHIGKFEVTREQYLPFLNAVDPNGTNALKLYQAVDFTLVASQPSGSKYRLSTTEANLPVTVSWYAAARFCNWLHNGKGGPGTSEGTSTTGAYNTQFFDDTILSNDPIAHNPDARFWIPTEDEWVKAAHYKGGSKNAGYWAFPNKTDEEPWGQLPPGGANSMNSRDRVHDSTLPTVNQKSAVGAYVLSKSPYGAFDMAGNMHEWTESWFEGDIFTPAKTKRMSRGGSFSWLTDHANIDYRLPSHRTEPNAAKNGFRLATSLEPTESPGAVNKPPVATNQTVNVMEDNEITFQLAAVDPDIGPAPLTYSVLTSPIHGTLTGTGSIRTYKPAANFYGTDSFTFRVNDGAINSNVATATLTVSNVNDVPKINAIAVTSSPVTAGKAVSLSVAASDVDNDTLTYAWNFGDGTTGTGSTPSHIYAVAGRYTASVVVSDGKAAGVNATILVTVGRN